MTDWAVGDLAIRTNEQKPNWPHAKSGAPPIGQIVRVDDVVTNSAWSCVGLVFNAYPSPHSTRSWADFQYRKIRPDEHEGNAEDWALLLETAKPKQLEPISEGKK